MTETDAPRYQVFVSSTFKDLKDERRKVLEAILETKAFPAGMELFPSANDEQWEFIKQEIQSSDYYIVIVAGKYGSLAPDGISFTEKEYDYAVEIGKPVMGFLFHDLGELRGNLLESDEGKRIKVERFRQKIAQGKLIKHYQNGDELKALVLHSLWSSFSRRPQTGWIRATAGRHIDDIKRIAALQDEVITLAAENARLKEAAADQRRLLSQGLDTVKWPVQITWIEEDDKESGEKGTFVFESTWNELLLTCFRDKQDRVSIEDVYARLKFLIMRKAIASGHDDRWVVKQKHEYSDQGWAKIAHDAKRLGSDRAIISDAEIKIRMRPMPTSEDLTTVKRDVQFQFQTLDYINVVGPENRRVWALTSPRGLLQIGLLLGKIRDPLRYKGEGKSVVDLV